MAFCKNCGKPIEEQTKFCPACGAPTEAQGQPTSPILQTPPPQQVPTSQQSPASQQTSTGGGNDFSAKLNALTDTADTTAEFDPNDIAQNKVMAILAYFGPLVLIPILAAKGSKFARYHSNQGLLLLIAAVLYGIAYGILSSILIAISWRLVFLTSILSLLSLVFLIPFIMGIVNASNGKAKELPVIGKFRILK